MKLVRVDGIEPTSLAWKAKVLPLNYTRYIFSKKLKLIKIIKSSFSIKAFYGL